MPYVTMAQREYAAREVQAFFAGKAVTVSLSPGELNYAVTRLLDGWLLGERCRTLSYTSLNSAIGVLECAKLELYRRLAVPYEDRKKEENGDVYDAR